MPRVYQKTSRIHIVKQRASVKRLLADLPAENSRQNALYYLTKFESYIQSNNIAADLDDLMNRRSKDPQGHVTHWEIMRDFLNSQLMSDAAYTTLKNADACIRNWYSVNNLALQDRRVKFPKDRRIQNLPPPMTLHEVRQLILDGKPNSKMKAAILIGLQTGMGRSEIFWSFGKDGLKQLTDVLGSDISSWNFDGKIPLKIEAIRKKTGQKFYTFLSRDALEAVKSYLLDQERRSGHEFKPTDRLFPDLKWPSVFSSNIRNQAIRAGLNGEVVQAGGSRYAKRYKVHLHALRALFKTVCADAGIPDAVSEFWSGRDWQRYNYNQSPYLIDADGKKIGEEHFRDLYRKMEPRLNILSGIEESKIEEKVRDAMESEKEYIRQLLADPKRLRAFLDERYGEAQAAGEAL